jgi:hypothetical protein
MTDFPRGWTLQAYAVNGASPSITVPATPGVVHVLDSYSAKLMNASTAAGTLSTLLLNSSDGAFSGYVLGIIGASQVTSGSVDVDTAGGSSLDLAAGAGASLTIAFGAISLTNSSEWLLIQGHDI